MPSLQPPQSYCCLFAHGFIYGYRSVLGTGCGSNRLPALLLPCPLSRSNLHWWSEVQRSSVSMVGLNFKASASAAAPSSPIFVAPNSYSKLLSLSSRSTPFSLSAAARAAAPLSPTVFSQATLASEVPKLAATTDVFSSNASAIVSTPFSPISLLSMGVKGEKYGGQWRLSSCFALRPRL